jgi:hypothetical protein
MKMKLKLVAIVVALSALIAGASLGLGMYLNSITFTGSIGPGASLSAAIAINMTADNGGPIIENQTGGSGSAHNGVPVNANSTLTLPSMANVTVAFANSSSLGPFSAFECTVQLYSSGSPAYTAMIDNSTLSYVMVNVAAGSYPLYVGYTFTAGPDPANVTITVNVTSP